MTIMNEFQMPKSKCQMNVKFQNHSMISPLTPHLAKEGVEGFDI